MASIESMDPSRDRHVDTDGSLSRRVGDSPLRRFFMPLASLRLTVFLFALSIFVVLAGTTAQTDHDIWKVVHDYFRLDLEHRIDTTSRSSLVSSTGEVVKELAHPKEWLAWVDLNILLPPSFFPGQGRPTVKHEIEKNGEVEERLSLPKQWRLGMSAGFSLIFALTLLIFVPKRVPFGVKGAIAAGLWALMGIGMYRTHGFYFPRGWAIGLLMTMNLTAAHLLRFRVDPRALKLGFFGLIAIASGVWAYAGYGFLLALLAAAGLLVAMTLLAVVLGFRFQTRDLTIIPGVVFVFLGAAATWLVILSGNNKQGDFLAVHFDWATQWLCFQAAVAIMGGLLVYVGIRLLTRATSRSHKFVQGLMIAVGCGLVIAPIYTQVTAWVPNPSQMRILWQLLKAEMASIILLTGCMFLFRKRAGVVLLHAGVGLLMFGELLVGVAAVESQMAIEEGETKFYSEDVRTVELAFETDASNNAGEPEGTKTPTAGQLDVVVIPEKLLKDAERDTKTLLTHPDLPVSIRVIEFMDNSDLVRGGSPEKSLANRGAGLTEAVRELREGNGVDGSTVDLASAYIELLDKNDKSLGTWLVSQFFDGQPVSVGGKTWNVQLRFQRLYKPFSMTLKDVRKLDYVGTATPRDYSSVVQIKNDEQEVEQEVRIWMNNPLRYNGETYYQSNYSPGNPARGIPETTTLQVVSNTGWMIPYVSCMIVMTGMLAHFLVTLVRFVTRPMNSVRGTPVEDITLEIVDESAAAGGGGSRGLSKKKSGDLKAKLASARQSRSRGTVAASRAPYLGPKPQHDYPGWVRFGVPAFVVVLLTASLGRTLSRPKPADSGIDFYAAGEIPILHGGRAKPLDTLAWTSLRMLSNKTSLKAPDGTKIPAIKWYLDTISGREVADKYEVIRIDHPALRGHLNVDELDRKTFLYSWEEIREGDDLEAQQEAVRELLVFVNSEEFRKKRSDNPELLNSYESGVIEFLEKLKLLGSLRQTFPTNELLITVFADRRKPGADSVDVSLGDYALILPELIEQVEAVEGSQPALFYSTTGHNWISALRTELRSEIAQRFASAETTGDAFAKEIADRMVKQLPRAVLAFEIQRVRDQLTEMLDTLEKNGLDGNPRPSQDRFAELVLRANFVPPGVSPDIVQLISQHSPSLSSEQLAGKLSADDRDRLYAGTVDEFFMSLQRSVSLEGREAIIAEMKANRPGTTAEKNARYLQMAFTDLVTRLLKIDDSLQPTQSKLAGMERVTLTPQDLSVSVGEEEMLVQVLQAYRSGDATEFNTLVTEYKQVIADQTAGTRTELQQAVDEAARLQQEASKKAMSFPEHDIEGRVYVEAAATAADDLTLAEAQLHERAPSLSRVNLEARFNKTGLLWILIFVYLLGGIVALVGLFGWSMPLNRVAFCIIMTAMVWQTAALVMRIMISGRPPVTNLYSSAVFIAWGGAAIAAVLELVFRRGLGNIGAAVMGAAGLGIGNMLVTEVPQFRGDTMTVMQAVLDTQFWLATHVVTITLGYATTYLAGLFGILYVLLGVFTTVLDRDFGKILTRMIYGTICFSILLSFFGTVLGGLWADDSWGRFWGWDPKENGALIIVLWNALVLHARWGGLVKDRGLAVLAIGGNIAVSWSWFGTNLLSVGLHAYGFAKELGPFLLAVLFSHLLLIGIGSVPKSCWISEINQRQLPGRK